MIKHSAETVWFACAGGTVCASTPLEAVWQQVLLLGALLLSKVWFACSPGSREGALKYDLGCLLLIAWRPCLQALGVVHS